MGRKKVFFPFTILVLMVAVATLISLAGCANTTSTTTAAPPAASTPPTTAPAVTTTAPPTTSAATTAPAPPTSSAPATTQATSGRTEILFGAVNSMTGTNALDGAEQKWAYEQAVADINAAGGIMVKSLGKKLPVKLVFEDDQSTPDGGAAAMEKLVKVDHVDLILSTCVGSINDADAVVADKYKIYYAGIGGWFGEEYEADHSQYASDMFFTGASTAETPFQIWDLQPANQRPQKIAVLVMDDINGQGVAKGVDAALQKYQGYTIVDSDVFTTGTKDFSSNILKIKSSGADALLWMGSPTDGITMVQQIKAANLNVKYLHGWMGFWPTEFEKTLGADSNYIVHDGFWSASFPYPGNQKLDQEFRASHDGDTSVTVGLYYAGVQVVAQAIERAGTLDSTVIKDTVFGGTFTGTTMGDLTFGSNGYCFTPSVAMQWMNGERELLWPHFSSVNYQLQWMPPWNQR